MVRAAISQLKARHSLGSWDGTVIFGGASAGGRGAMASLDKVSEVTKTLHSWRNHFIYGTEVLKLVRWIHCSRRNPPDDWFSSINGAAVPKMLSDVLPSILRHVELYIYI